MHEQQGVICKYAVFGINGKIRRARKKICVGRIWLAQQCTGEGLEGAAHIGPGGRIWSRAKGAGMRQDAVNAAGTSGATLLEAERRGRRRWTWRRVVRRRGVAEAEAKTGGKGDADPGGGGRRGLFPSESKRRRLHGCY